MEISYFYINTRQCRLDHFKYSLQQHWPGMHIGSMEDLPQWIENNLSSYKVVFADLDIYMTSLNDPDVDLWINNVMSLSTKADLVFLINTEMHITEIIGVYKKVVNACLNVYFVLPGYLNLPDKAERFIPFQYWIDSVNRVYKGPLKSNIDRLTPYAEKHKSFDILLGTQKFHRDFLYQNLSLDTVFLKKNIMTYYKTQDPDGRSKFWTDKDSIIEFNTLDNSSPDTFYSGHNVRYRINQNESIIIPLSFVIPLEIYNQTNFTVISETNYDNEFSFFTEKTAKPILARRMFVALSGHRFLENLRREGFKTFDEFIDERYDFEPDPYTRFCMVLKEIQKISRFEPNEIIPFLEKLKPVVDHNYRVMTETDWSAKSISHIEKTIEGYLKKLSI